MNTVEFENAAQVFSSKNAYFMGRAATLAYQDQPAIKAELVGDGLSLFEFFQGRETQAFIGGNDEMLVLSFRGTEPTKLADWMSDLDLGLVAGPGGKVHEGFNIALSYVWRDIWRFISAERKRRSLWVTGHSLGAALATLAVAKLRLEKDEPVNGLYTFGQPRTGGREFATRFDADFAAKTFRYVNNNDVVPRVPLRAMEYSHVGTFRYFDADGLLHRDEMIWWDKLLDRMQGRVGDLLKPGTDGLKDHGMEKYLANLKRAL